MSESHSKTWKLELRYGRLKTTFKHYTVIADGIAGEISGGFSCPEGPAFMGMKLWASDTREVAHMVRLIGRQIGFNVSGKIQVYETEPLKPPKSNPHAYDINFTPYQA